MGLAVTEECHAKSATDAKDRKDALRACLKTQFWVARATGHCRQATRRTERERQFEPMGMAFSQRCSRKFRPAGRGPGRTSRARHPLSKQALRKTTHQMVSERVTLTLHKMEHVPSS